MVHSAISDLDSVMPHIKQIPVGEATVRAFATDPMEEGDVGGRHLEDERLLLLNSGARARPPGRGHGAVWE